MSSTEIVNNISNQISNNTTSFHISFDTYLLTLFVFLTGLALIMFYFLSYSFRVNQTITKMKIYTNFQTINSMNRLVLKNFKLADFYVASSYHTANSGFQLLDYVSLDMILANLKVGARYLEFSIFNSQYGEESVPIIANGYQQGEWKLSANVVNLEDACLIIKENAFTVARNDGGVYNPRDPLFISLNLKTNYQQSTLNKLHDLIIKYFGNRLLPSKYSFSKFNLGEARLVDLMGKVVILSSPGFEGSKLEELINYSWEGADMYRMADTEVDERNDLIEHNRTKLSIVYPVVGQTFWDSVQSYNYDPQIAWSKGCQFVAMNYQIIDKNMDKYIQRFKNQSFILKPKKLR